MSENTTIEWADHTFKPVVGLRPRLAGLSALLRRSSVPFFFKQWGEFNAAGLRVGKREAGNMLDGWDYRQGPEPPAGVNPYTRTGVFG